MSNAYAQLELEAADVVIYVEELKDADILEQVAPHLIEIKNMVAQLPDIAFKFDVDMETVLLSVSCDAPDGLKTAMSVLKQKDHNKNNVMFFFIDHA